jgi:YVTN family beta-propeller protein
MASAAAYEVVATIPTGDVGSNPRGIAISATRNALYVVATGNNALNTIDLATNTRSATIGVGTDPFWVALSSNDDTAYVTNYVGNSVTAIRTATQTVSGTVSSVNKPVGVVVSADDTVYVSRDDTPTGNTVGAINARTLTLGGSVGTDPGSIGIGLIDAPSSADDTVIVTNQESGTFQTIAANGLTLGQTTNTGALSQPWGVAVLPNRSKYYVSLYGDDSVVRVDAATNTIDDTIGVGNGPQGMAISPDGTRLFVANGADSTLSVIDTATGTVIQTVALAGGALGVAVHPTTGTIYVSNNLGNTVSVIELVSPPPPPPPVPPSPPLNVTAEPGNKEAVVTWQAPASPGSFPVGTYEVTSEPGNKKCLVAAPTLTCTVTGLTNGVPYTFTVKALNGAGWSGPSAPSTAVIPSATSPLPNAIVREIPTGKNPWGVAVNYEDDTVYVTNYGARTMTVIAGRTGTVSSTVPVGDVPQGVAVNQIDDTVYVANRGAFGPSAFAVSVINGATATPSGLIRVPSLQTRSFPEYVAVNNTTGTIYITSTGFGTGPGPLFIANPRSNVVDDTLFIGRSMQGVTVNQRTGTVYVANSTGVGVVNGRTNRLEGTIPMSDWAFGVAVDQTDDTIFTSNPGFYDTDNKMSIVDPRTKVVRQATVGTRPLMLAVDSASDLVYVPSVRSNTLSVVDGRTGEVTGNTFSIRTAKAAAVDEAGTNAGLVYVSRANDRLAVIARATPRLVDTSGAVGSTARLNLTIPQISYPADDSTVAAVTFGGVPATILGRTAGQDQWSVQAPEGTGSVPVVVTFNGGLTAPAGTFTYTVDPTPKPPLDVTGEPGDGEVTVQWKEPESPGDSPITEYEVVSEPDGKTCTVAAPTLTCKIPGLTNGTPYTFTVRAKNGSGWGPTSKPSPVIIPVGPVPPSGTPGVPRDITEVPGPQEILVTWKEPEDPGDTPILEYIATVHPSGKTCRVPAPQLSCRIPGLEDGVPYEVTVVAVNGNGAGKPSPEGAPVTPAADAQGIVITGDRDDARRPNGLATVQGLTTGIAVGTKLTAYTRIGATGDFKAGAKVTVNVGGNFTWKREVKRGKDLQVYFAADTTTSNTLTLPARTITISGSRDNQTITKGKNLVSVKGTSVNVPPGTTLTAKVSTTRGGPYTDGVTVTVSADGTFTWKREVNKGKTLWVYFIGGKAISNRLTFPPK